RTEIGRHKGVVCLDAFEAGFDRGRVKRSAVVERDALTDGEGICLAVSRNIPLFGKTTFQGGVVGRLPGDQRVEDIEDDLGADGVAEVGAGIEALWIGVDGDDEGGGRAGAGRRRNGRGGGRGWTGGSRGTGAGGGQRGWAD